MASPWHVVRALAKALGFVRDVVRAVTAKEPIPPRTERRDLNSIAAESARKRTEAHE